MLKWWNKWRNKRTLKNKTYTLKDFSNVIISPNSTTESFDKLVSNQPKEMFENYKEIINLYDKLFENAIKKAELQIKIYDDFVSKKVKDKNDKK